MNAVRVPQSVVGIIGRGATVTLRSPDTIRVEPAAVPDGLRPREANTRGTGEVPVHFAASRRIEKGMLRLRVTNETTGDTGEISLPVRVWGPRMSFICLVQSSNTHVGWDPRPMAQYYRRLDEDLVLYDDDKSGNHAWVHARKLERIFHKHGTPVTWLIDDTVAAEQAPQIAEWHGKYGDGVSFLPRSYFYYNKRNYNLTHTPEDTREILTPQYAALLDAFERAGWPVYCRTMGADQWVGSPGGVFVEAAQQMGFEGIWGIGYDHQTCDTSMYHMGAPWDVFKPKAGNFRIPGAGNSFWCFQWTTRDIVNTSYFRPTVGSTTFSTDADDIRYNGIPRFQDDYYARLLQEYRRNLSHHDVNVFLVHQEDHDSHIHGSNDVLEAFVDQVHEMETFATMDEIAAWLNRRFAPEEHPYQLIEMDDPLTCHAEMQAASLVGDIPRRFAKNPSWGRGGRPNPPHLAYYGEDFMWICEQPAPAPKILYNYTKSDRYPFAEDGEYPEETVPALSRMEVRQQNAAGTLTIALSFDASAAIEALPVVFWNEPLNNVPEGVREGTDNTGRPCHVWRTRSALAVLVHDVREGENTRTVTVALEE